MAKYYAQPAIRVRVKILSAILLRDLSSNVIASALFAGKT